MPKASQPIAPTPSRLIELLSDMTDTHEPISHKNFSLHLSQLIDLSDSFSLSDTFRGIPRLKPPTPSDDNNGNIKEAFIQHRSDMVSFVIKSFAATTEVSKPFRLPELTAEQLSEADTAFDRLHRFYVLQQSDVDAKVMQCRNFVRKNIENHSLAMKQLVTLDVAVANTMAANTRQAFTMVPKLLRIRFQQLLISNSEETIEVDLAGSPILPWFNDFVFEMRQLLLTELDVRLQPVLGLIEAFDEEINTPL